MSSMFIMTSCVTSTTVSTGSDISYYDDYYYNGITYPVLYVNSSPYYYCGGRWTLIPHIHYRYIRHYHKPMYFRGSYPQGYVHRPHTTYRPYRPHKPVYMPSNTRPHGNYNQYHRKPSSTYSRPSRQGNSIGHQHMNTQRPNYRGTQSRGGRR